MLIEACSQLITNVRNQQPLVHHITNEVTINDCANITLAIGASPVMATSVQEVEAMVTQASALVLNTGTLTGTMLEAMLLAGKKANALNIPVIIDPVAVGATPFRYKIVHQLLEQIHFTIIKGNMSEIKTLAGLDVQSKGVDADTDATGAYDICRSLAKELNTTIVITGKEDILSDGNNVYSLYHGDPMLSRITGTGCMTASLLGCFAGVTNDSLLAAITGTMVMGLAGEKAVKNLKPNEGTGTFRIRLLDAISLMDSNSLLKEGHINVL